MIEEPTKVVYADTDSITNANGFLLAQSDGCSVYQFRNETGDGTMTCYDVFPGAMLCFNDFHMAYFDSEYTPGRNVFVIDHCREGKMEYLAAENAYAYVGAGDIKLDRRLTHTGRFIFPSSHYHGMTIAFDMEIAAKALTQEVKDFPVNLVLLQSKYCPGRYPNVVHETENFGHIFHELYQVPEKIRIPYFKIKMMELLLYLYALELPSTKEERPYYYKTQVEKVKAIQSFLIQHMAENYTQEQLSMQFDIPLTAMKNCFKSVYGASIGTWLTEYRMNRAAEILLADRDKSVAEIAGMAGYDSASKFAIAFRKVMGMTPTEYRAAIRSGKPS